MSNYCYHIFCIIQDDFDVEKSSQDTSGWSLSISGILLEEHKRPAWKYLDRKLTFIFRLAELDFLECVKLSQIVFSVSSSTSRYGLKKISSKNIENFWSKNIFENFPKKYFLEKSKISKILKIFYMKIFSTKHFSYKKS